MYYIEICALVIAFPRAFALVAFFFFLTSSPLFGYPFRPFIFATAAVRAVVVIVIVIVVVVVAAAAAFEAGDVSREPKKTAQCWRVRPGVR